MVTIGSELCATDAGLQRDVVVKLNRPHVLYSDEFTGISKPSTFKNDPFLSLDSEGWEEEDAS